MYYYFKLSKAFTLLELMISVAILAMIMAIAIPNLISYRNKSFCSVAETDAKTVAAAITDYFGTPVRTQTPTFEDLKLNLSNHVEILGSNPNECITIEVTDISQRCPLDYRLSRPGWDSHIFRIEVKNN